MARSTVSLGSAELLSSTSGTTLKLHSSITFASSEEDAELALRSLTCAALSSSTGGRVWIAKGSEYELIVKLDFNHDIERAFQDEYTEAAAAYLQSTKLWKGFLLRVTALRESLEQDGNSLIRLSLDHLDDNTDSTRARVHKLADEVPLHDVSVPPSTRVIECDSVCLEMRVASSTQSPRSNTTQADDDELLDRFTGNHFAPEAAHEPRDEVFAPKRFKTVPAQRCPEFSGGQISCLKRSYSSNDLQQQACRPVELSQFLELFDAAFRLAISAPTKRSWKHIQVTGVESFRHLSDVVPSLWRSGYLEEVSSRAVLLPTISHAMSSMAINPSGKRLMSKLHELLRRRRLSVHVWSLAQHAPGNRNGCVVGAVEEDALVNVDSIAGMDLEMDLDATLPKHQTANDSAWLDDDFSETLPI